MNSICIFICLYNKIATHWQDVSLTLFSKTRTKHDPPFRQPVLVVSFSVQGKLLTLSFNVACCVVVIGNVVGLGISGTLPQLSENRVSTSKKLWPLYSKSILYFLLYHIITVCLNSQDNSPTEQTNQDLQFLNISSDRPTAAGKTYPKFEWAVWILKYWYDTLFSPSAFPWCALDRR